MATGTRNGNGTVNQDTTQQTTAPQPAQPAGFDPAMLAALVSQAVATAMASQQPVQQSNPANTRQNAVQNAPQPSEPGSIKVWMKPGQRVVNIQVTLPDVPRTSSTGRTVDYGSYRDTMFDSAGNTITVDGKEMQLRLEVWAYSEGRSKNGGGQSFKLNRG